jgi:F0F1-type ATP synthase assembly protein I
LLLDRELLKKTGVFTLVSGELIACIGGGFLFGQWLDTRLNSAPWCAAGIATMGLVYSVWRIQGLSKRWMAKREP